MTTTEPFLAFFVLACVTGLLVMLACCTEKIIAKPFSVALKFLAAFAIIILSGWGMTWGFNPM